MRPRTTGDDRGARRDHRAAPTAYASLPSIGARGRLLDRLDDHDVVTVVRAPAGFGKQSLLRAWAETREDDTADTLWVEPPPDHRGPAAFWSWVAQALEPGHRPPGRSSGAEAVQAIVGARNRPVTLLCPRFDRVADRDLVTSLLKVVRSTPQLSVVATARDHVELPGARTGGDPIDALTERARVVTAAELLLDLAECEDALRGAGLEVTADRVATLHRVTGGWPALVHAAIRAMGEASGRVGDEEVTSHAVRDHLNLVVLPDLEPAALPVLRILAVARRLTTSAAATILDTSEHRAALLLARLVDAGLVVARVEDGERIHAWPAALQAALREQLEAEDPARLLQLEARLARWHHRRGHAPEALEHAFAAADADLVGEVLDRYWLPLLVYDNDLLIEHFRSAPRSWYDGRAFLHGVRDLSLRLYRDPTAGLIDIPVDPTEVRRLVSGPDVRAVLNLGVVQLFGLRRAHRLEEALRLADRLRDAALAARVTQPDAVSDLIAPIFLLTAAVLEISGDLRSAIDPLRWCYATAGDSVLLGSARHSASHLAMDLAVLGEYDEARRWLGLAAATPVVEGWVAPRAQMAMSVAELLIAASALDRSTARTALRELIALADPLDELWPIALYARAQYALLWGDRRAAVQHIINERTAREPSMGPGLTLSYLARAAEVDLLLALGRRQQAVHAAATARGPALPELAVTQARLALVMGRPQEAVSRAQDFLLSTPAAPRAREDLGLIEVVGEHRSGRGERAADLLRRMLDDQPGPSLRAFAMVPRADLLALARQVPDLDGVLKQLDALDAPEVFPADLAPASLTRRELIILRHLGSGLTRDEIARRLSVSSNTVKSQAHSVYRKLGVRSRDEAVLIAREQGLLG